MAKTKNLIRASADVVTILTLAKGDIYKRIEKSTTYNPEALMYGIVTDVMSNGEQSAIVTVEYTSDYNGAKISRKVFQTNDELALFTATLDDFRGAVGDILALAQREVKTAQTALDKKQGILREVEKASTLELTTAESGVYVKVDTETVAE